MIRGTSQITVFLVCVWAAICVMEACAATGPSTLPDMSTAAMTIPWSDFKALLESVQPRPADLEEEEPPADWAVASAEYDAELVAPDTVKVNARMEVVVWKPRGWVTIPVVGDSVAPISTMLDGEPTSLVSLSKGWFHLVLDGPGRHEFETTFFVRCSFDEGSVTVEFPCARTPLTSMRLRLPTRDAHVMAHGASRISVERKTDSLSADLVFRAADSLGVSWSRPASLQKPKPVEEARVTCLASTLVTVSDRYMTCESRLRFDVLKGGLDTFHVGLPASVNVLTVTGQGAAWSASESDDTTRIEVKVNHRVAESYDLTLRYEAPFENEMATVTVPEIVVEDVARETGYVGIAAKGSVELNTAPELEGLTRVDISDLPTSIRAMSANPVLLAFKYTEHPYLLAMDVRKLEDVPVRVASIDRAELTTVLTDDGLAITRAVYDVRNNVKQFLRVDVNEDAEIWGAGVGGHVVKPARDSKSSKILIPLFKSVEANRTLGSFPVELVYMQRLPDVPKLTGKLNLQAPATDILVNELYWEVLMPEERSVFRSTGDLKPFRQARSGRPQLARRATGTKRETIYRIKEGIERFFITDINNPAGSSMGRESRYRGSPLAGSKAGSAPAAIAIAGVLPVRIDLPVDGVAHHFRRIIVPQGKPLELRLFTYSARLYTAAKCLAAALSLLIGFGLGRAIWVLSRGRRPARHAVAATCAMLALLVAANTIFGRTLAPGYVIVAGAAVATLLGSWLNGRTAATGRPRAEMSSEIQHEGHTA